MKISIHTFAVLNLVLVLFTICCQVVLAVPDVNGVTYTWKTKFWSSCLVRCGEGSRLREVSCQDSSGLSVPESNCPPTTKPATVELCFKVCDEHKHRLRWQTEAWSRCHSIHRIPSCMGRTSVAGVARRKVVCVYDLTGRVVDPAACENFWDRPEGEMACSMDVGSMLECPQDCVTTSRKVSCPPHNCPSKNKWNTDYREITEVVVAPTEGGNACPIADLNPVCPSNFSAQDCQDTDADRKRYLLKIGEWGPCERSTPKLSLSRKFIQISLRPKIGISRRNISCITDKGASASLSLCNVVEMPSTARRCIVPSHCLTSPWSEWRVNKEGCIASDGQVHPEVRIRVRKVVQMPVGAGADPCPPLFEERKVVQDLPSCYKYEWLPLEWSECELRVHGQHGESVKVRPTCGSGLQYRQLACVRASDASPVSDSSLCREQMPPTLQRCKVPCQRDCRVSKWSRWGPCTFLKGHDRLEIMEDGYRRRERSILVTPSGGGAPCPHLQEATWCMDVEQFSWQYGKWSNCTLATDMQCGTGKRTRDKTCVKLNGNPLENFLCDLHHDAEDKEYCTIPCPDDCVVSEWSDWSTCSLACHDGEKLGQKTRNRTLLAIAGKDGTCPHVELTDKTYCNTHFCDPFRWTAGDWGACEPADGRAGCGTGMQRRKVNCTHGWEEKAEFGLCSYLDIPPIERECEIPCPVDCVLSNFSDWSLCEGSCNQESVQNRSRLVLQHPRHGGRECPSSLLVERTCTRSLEPECLRQKNSLRLWIPGEWNDCVLPDADRKCGMGFQIRNVSCVQEVQDGGSREVEPHFCLTDNLQPPSAVRSCEVTCSSGCVLTTWTAWSQCEHTHDATRTRTREVLGPLSGIEKCSSAFKLREDQKCPPDEANYEGLHWMSCIVDNANSSYSGYSCGGGYKHRFAITGSGPGLERDYCWQDCPRDCRMSDWGEWTDCDVPCGVGFRERRREVEVPANHLGRPCPEGVVEKTEIQRDVCRIVCADFHWKAGGWNKCKISNKHAKNTKCGSGTQFRTVRCLDKRTEQEVDESKCDPLEKPESSSHCTLHCPGECVMSPWSVTLKCQEPCSTSNYQEETRVILRHPNTTQWGPCPDDTIHRVPCTLQDNCHEHHLEVGPWGSCVLPEGALCGEGTLKASLRCVRSDGRQVDAVLCEKSHQSLSLKGPTTKPCYVDCPVDCVMSEWSTWNDTECVACGHGMTKHRTRSVLQPPSDGGRPCPTETEQSMPCPFRACYHWNHSDWSSCDLENGDCGYGVRRRVVKCVRYDGLEVDRSLCLPLNVTFSKGDWLDPAWMSMAQEDSQEEEACHIPCPGACVLSEWSKWSHCHKNCRIGQTVGYQTSSRAVLFSPPNATESCSTQLLRTRPCWSNDCNFFRWKLKNGSLVCEGSDGIVVQGGCASEPPPCDRWCEKLGGACNSSTGLCRCGPQGPLILGPASAPCTFGPRPPANHSSSTTEIKYYPDDSQVSFWMYAMISIGTAFVIFVAVTVYLMCSPERH
ncbi:hypothetical protein JTE90_024259 [Oedothorax gibbosus]|uniref:Spondin-like TSP1 domain-containing protein n=1 Tax=Oedothorax gibbosus TaxID=931172 RepID=A0AAV6VPQ1_9ARAC|nr:hypothetical protein JTE90_024259 [Oedothorax gibbosus]